MVKRTVIARTAAGLGKVIARTVSLSNGTKQSLRLIAVFAALLLSILPSPAAPPSPTRGISVVADDPQTGERVEVGLYDKMYAVVIGIDEYPGLKPDQQLKYAVSDARAVAETLERRYAFEKVVVLKNSDASRMKIMRTLLSEIGEGLTENDALLVFFAGHGYTERTADGRDIGWIVPYDGSLSRSESYRNISMSEVKTTISDKISARHIFYIVDACYAGILSMRGEKVERAERSLSYLREKTRERGRQVLTAGDDKQTVLDDGPKGHSVFTGRLIEKLEETDDYITANELSSWIGERVFEDAKERGHTQTPQYGRMAGLGDFVFVPSSRKREEDVRREKEETEHELVDLRKRAEEAKKRKDTAESARIVKEREAAEARKKALELREQELAELAKKREAEAETARIADEKRKQAAVEEEARLRKLKEEAEKLRSEIKSGDENDIQTASARVKELTKQIRDIEASYDKAAEDAVARITADYDARIAVVKAEKRGMFETDKEFRERIDETVRKLAGERDREKNTVSEKFRAEREKQTASARVERSSFTERLYEEEVAVELKEYVAEKEEFEVEVTAANGGKTSAQLAVPRAEAKGLWNDRAALIGRVIKSVEEDGKPTLVATRVIESAKGYQSFIEGSALSSLTDVNAALETAKKQGDVKLTEFLTRVMLPKARQKELYARMVKRQPFEPELVSIPGGTFQMGSNDSEGDEKPVHTVTVDGFMMGKYEVTFAEYDAFCDATGREKPKDEGWGRGRRPVINVSWNDAVAYCEWLSQKTGKRYRLPTEAEWEYAARGGKGSSYGTSTGLFSNDLANGIGTGGRDAWQYTSPVGSFPANPFGLYDMSGNVWERCADWYEGSYYGNSPSRNPTGPSSGSSRVVRGGSWVIYSDGLRAASRVRVDPSFLNSVNGFRVVADLED